MSQENVAGVRPPCTTVGCEGMATHKALVDDQWYPYCWDCAETVHEGDVQGDSPLVELIFVDEPDPYDADELVKWATMYGHPEEWAKRAQAAHLRAEKLAARVDVLERALRQIGEHPRLAVQIAAEVLGEPLVLDPLSPTTPPAGEDLGTL